MPKAKHAGPGQGKPGSKAELGLGGPTLTELGVSKKLSVRAQKLAALAAEERARLVEQLKADGKGVTPAAVLAASRQSAKREKPAAFDVVVMIDPPWPMQKIDRDEPR